MLNNCTISADNFAGAGQQRARDLCPPRAEPQRAIWLRGEPGHRRFALSQDELLHGRHQRRAITRVPLPSSLEISNSSTSRLTPGRPRPKPLPELK